MTVGKKPSWIVQFSSRFRSCNVNCALSSSEPTCHKRSL